MKGKEIIINDKTFLLNVKDEIVDKPDYIRYGITNEDIKQFSDYKKLLREYEDKKYDFQIKIETIFTIIAFNTLLALFSIFSDNGLKLYIGLSIYNIFLFHWLTRTIVSFILAPFTILPTYLLLKRFYKKPPEKPKHYDKVEQISNEIETYKNKLNDLFITYDENGKYLDDIINKAEKNLSITVKSIKDYIHHENSLNKEKCWYDLDPFEFEREVAHWYERQGYKAEVTKKSADGGIDIIIKKNNYTAYVQCKHYKSTKISAEIVRQLYGVVKADGVSEGIIVCLSGITEPARDFMDKVNMKFHDVNDLIKNPDESIHIEQENEDIEKVNNSWIKIGNIQIYTTLFIQESEVKGACGNLNKNNKYPNYLYRYIKTYGHYTILFGKEEILENFIKSSYYSYFNYVEKRQSYRRSSKRYNYRRYY